MMNTFLFTWNPSRWPWSHLDQSIDQLYKTGSTSEAWSCSSFKKAKIGDRAFLMKLGSEPKGIIASGTIISNPFYSEFRTGDTVANPRMRVVIQFDVLLNAAQEPILPLQLLTTGNLSAQRWTPEASGISIRPELVDDLEALWFDFVTTQKIRHNPFHLSGTGAQTVYIEGTPTQVTMTKYERNPYARKVCIAHYGLSCAVCDFNFEKHYGEIGKDFIHVHHLTQLATVGKQYSVDPIRDLRPVCPNCHAMIHRGKEAISIDNLKSLLQKRMSV